MAAASSAAGDISTSSSTSTATSASCAQLTGLNAQLLTHGWAKRPLDLSALSEREHTEAVGVIYALLGSAVAGTDNLEALAARHRTLEYEHERAVRALTGARAAQRKAEGESAGWKSRVVDLEKRLELEEAKGKELREEVGRGRKALEGVRVAAGHEQKRMQSKMDQALAKIARYSADASAASAQGQGMVVLNTIPSGRALPAAAPLLEQSLRDLAEIRAGLQEENESFRHVVVAAGNAMREALSMSRDEPEPARLHPSQFFILTPNLRAAHPHIAVQPSFAEIADARLKSLIADCRAQLAQRVLRVVVGEEAAAAADPEAAEAAARAQREEERRVQDLMDRVKDLEVEVGCARGREEEARKGMEELASRQMAESMAKASERDQDTSDLLNILRERERLEEERRKVREMQDGFQRERRRFEHERTAFLDERRRVDVDAILAQLPSSPAAGLASLNAVAAFASDAGSSSTSGSSSGSGSGYEASSSSSTIRAPSNDLSNSDSPIKAVPAPLAIARSPPPRSALPPHMHLPSSPSPLSPHKPRTPKGKAKAYVALTSASKGKRARTPLARLVLEKAVRQKSRDEARDAGGVAVAAVAASASASASAEGLALSSNARKVSPLGSRAASGSGSGSGSAREALGEGSKRANLGAVAVGTQSKTLSQSAAGKGKAVSGLGTGTGRRTPPVLAASGTGTGLGHGVSHRAGAVPTKRAAETGRAASGMHAQGASAGAGSSVKARAGWR